MSRRSFLGGAAGLATIGLAGCAGGAESARLTSSETLRVWNWPDYIDIDDATGASPTLASIEAELGLDVRYDPSYEDNAAAWSDVFEPAVRGNGSIDYDIVMPTNWLAARLIEQGWVEQLPLELIPNHVNIDPAYLTPSWDRGARFHMPWQSGITGIAYNPEKVARPITTITELFDGSVDGVVGAIPEMREAVGLAMLLDDADPTRPTAESTAAALDRLEAAQTRGDIVFTYDFTDGLKDGSLGAAMAWSGDIVQLQAEPPEVQAERPDIQFVIPEEGAIQWFDTMIIAGNTPNATGAARFLNYVYDPAAAAQITEWVQYLSPVLGVRELLLNRGGESAELANNPLVFPDDETRRRLFTWGSLDADVERDVEARFAEISS